MSDDSKDTHDRKAAGRPGDEHEGDNPKLRDGSSGNELKDTDDWVTGDEPATAAQLSYLHTLAGEAGEEVPEDLTKAAASEHIDRLQQKTGRGADG